MAGLTHLLPGAADLLAGLQRRGITVGLCSNKPKLFSQALLQHLGVADVFALVLGPEDVARPKPAPDMLRKALALVGRPPARVLYVGDMTVDIETARAAGLCVWIVATGSDRRDVLEAARPDRLLANLGELVAELDAIG